MYDLGNTSVEFAIPMYLTVWIVNDLGVDARWFGLASAVSSWAIGLSGPWIGVRADERLSRRRWFTVSALLAALFFGTLVFLPSQEPWGVGLVIVTAMAANYFFQLSSLIYNASLLSASEGANVISVSSLGIGLSFVGGAAGVGIMELLISGRLPSGPSPRGFALLAAAAIFLLCALPSILAKTLWKQPRTPSLPSESLLTRMSTLWRETARKHRAGWFLAGYFALNSSIMGLTLYLPLYVRSTTGLEGVGLLAAVGTAVFASAVGAGSVALLRPPPHKARTIIVVAQGLMGINALLFSLATSLPLVLTCTALHGLFSGAAVPTVRAAFALSFPAEYQALAFGLFGAVQRVSQGLGAALWPLADAAGNGHSAALGVAAMGVLALAGIPFFFRWRLDS